jgi:toxin YoeB
MKKIWDEEAWEDYLYWQAQDRKTLSRINQLLKDIERNPYEGIGKPEPLKHDLQEYWSRRIDEVNRLVYRIAEGRIEIYQCRTHYNRRG